MTAHPPPVPPDQQSDKGAPAPSPKESANPKHDPRPRNTAEQAQQGNTRQNTTHQGYQQDR